MMDKRKVELLKRCVELLEEVDSLQQDALGDSDVCYANHNKLAELIEDFEEDIYSLENPVT